MNPPSGSNAWIFLISALLTGGGAKFLYDMVKDIRNRPTKEQQHVSTIDASIVTIARARDELAEDNSRLRSMIGEERSRWDSERSAWAAERLSLRSEIASLEALIRREREESAARYDALLQRLSDLSARHARNPEEGAT